MRIVLSRIVRFLARDDGPTVAEYAVILALLVGAVISIVGALGGTTASWWDSNTTQIINASNSAAS